MTTPDSLVETLAAQWDGCEYDAPGGLAAQSAPLAQQAAREYPPLPEKVYLGDDVSYGYDSESLRDYVDADRAAAQVEPAELTNDQITAGYLAMLESIEVVGMDRAVQRFRDAVSKGDHQ